jgi:hypothetical protein
MASAKWTHAPVPDSVDMQDVYKYVTRMLLLYKFDHRSKHQEGAQDFNNQLPTPPSLRLQLERFGIRRCRLFEKSGQSGWFEWSKC